MDVSPARLIKNVFRRDVCNQKIEALRDKAPLFASLFEFEIERPTRQIQDPRRPIEALALILEQTVFETHGIRKLVLPPGAVSPVQIEIVISADTQDQFEVLTAEPGIDAFQLATIIAKVSAHVPTVDEHITFEPPQVFMLTMRIADNDNLHSCLKLLSGVPSID